MGSVTFAFVDAADESLGATLVPINPALRAQLDIPSDRGVVLATVTPEGPAARSGLHTNDILLTLAGNPLGSADELKKRLQEAGDKEVQLVVLRGGEKLALPVRPVTHVTIGPAEATATEYFLGVAVGVLDSALREQLKLKGDGGLIVNEVAEGSPAAKAGVRPHDILTEYNGKNLDRHEKLSALVNQGKDGSGALKLLRGGKEMTVRVTPERRTVKRVTGREAVRIVTVPRPFGGDNVPAWVHGRALATVPGLPTPPGSRVETLEKEIRDLKSSLDEIRALLKSQQVKNKDGGF